MSKVIFTMSMSVDGFIRAANPTAEEPLGHGGEKLHEWAMGNDPVGSAFLAKSVASIGAVITGRANYDDSIQWWQADGPTGPNRVPVFVVTHKAPKTSPKGGVYRFVGSVAESVRLARETAGEKDVSIMGGPDVGNQALVSGMVDEVTVSIAPVLFGAGTRFFGELPEHIQLEQLSVVSSPAATHISYRVLQ